MTDLWLTINRRGDDDGDVWLGKPDFYDETLIAGFHAYRWPIDQQGNAEWLYEIELAEHFAPDNMPEGIGPFRYTVEIETP